MNSRCLTVIWGRSALPSSARSVSGTLEAKPRMALSIAGGRLICSELNSNGLKMGTTSGSGPAWSAPASADRNRKKRSSPVR